MQSGYRRTAVDGTAVATRYAIRVAGELDEATAEAFAGLDVTRGEGVTAIVGDFDQAALHGQLERIRALGLELIDVRKIRRRA